MFGEFAARSGRRAERTGASSDRADRLNPNTVFSKRYSYQRRGHLTVSEVESYRLTQHYLPTHIHPNTVAEPWPPPHIINPGPRVCVYHTGVHVIWVAIVTA